MTQGLNDSMNYKGVCRTAQATPGLLNTGVESKKSANVCNFLALTVSAWNFVEHPQLHWVSEIYFLQVDPSLPELQRQRLIARVVNDRMKQVRPM